MAEPELTSLARAWEQQTVEPDFELLVGRAQARRRRRRVLSVVASAAVVLLVVVLASALLQRGPSSSPLPSGRPQHSPSRSAGRHHDVDWVIAHGHLVSYAAGSGGWFSYDATPPGHPDRVLTVWQHCRPVAEAACLSARRLTDRSGREVAAGPFGGRGDWGSAPNVSAWGDVFVVAGPDVSGIVVDPTGASRSLRETGPEPIRSGDLVVRRGKVGLAVVDPRAGTTWPLLSPAGHEGWFDGTVSPDGTAWLLPAPAPGQGEHTVEVRWLRAGTWHGHELWKGTPSTGGTTVPGLLAVSGTHVVAMSSFDGATVLPVGTFAVSTDSGDHWSDLTKAQLPFDAVDTIAATSGGTLYVQGYAHDRYAGLFRSTDASWTHFVLVPGSGRVGGLAPGGPVVLAVTGSWKHPGLAAFDDHGNRTEVPLR